jgi:hypothetical protein
MTPPANRTVVTARNPRATRAPVQSRTTAQGYDDLVIGGRDTHHPSAIQTQDPVKYCCDAHVRTAFQFVVSATPNLEPDHVRVSHFTSNTPNPNHTTRNPLLSERRTHTKPRRATHVRE